MAETTVWMLAGATATGKSDAAQLLAERRGFAILSADSMLVYKGMDIGTAKPMPADRGDVRYAGIDLVTPGEPFSAGRWLEEARRALSDGGGWIVAGGTGLYFKALTEGLDAGEADPAVRAKWKAVFETGGIGALREALERMEAGAVGRLGEDAVNPRRLLRALEVVETGGFVRTAPKPHARFAVLRIPRETLRRRIAARVEAMFRAGLLEETERLTALYPQWSQTAAGAIGYAEARAVLTGAMKLDEAKERIAVRTNQLAKRQETWFRHQVDPVWIDLAGDEPPDAVAEKVECVWREYGSNRI
ncbi:MAG: tRNA (adenosine(37)-N6)-dimethylallyltransferase MiaA [Kiritimatiellae bacterium]|nr:tRNA (adenosine(37)-N6)-dimethylallyltransferase MiaA [Kiritimatiellia bacterium]